MVLLRPRAVRRSSRGTPSRAWRRSSMGMSSSGGSSMGSAARGLGAAGPVAAGPGTGTQEAGRARRPAWCGRGRRLGMERRERVPLAARDGMGEAADDAGLLACGVWARGAGDAYTVPMVPTGGCGPRPGAGAGRSGAAARGADGGGGGGDGGGGGGGDDGGGGGGTRDGDGGLMGLGRRSSGPGHGGGRRDEGRRFSAPQAPTPTSAGAQAVARARSRTLRPCPVRRRRPSPPVTPRHTPSHRT